MINLLVRDGLELGGEAIELGVLAGLNTLVLLGVPIEFTSGQHKLASVSPLGGGLDPAALPGVAILECFLEVDLREGDPGQSQDKQQFHLCLLSQDI